MKTPRKAKVLTAVLTTFLLLAGAFFVLPPLYLMILYAVAAVAVAIVVVWVPLHFIFKYW
jgi:hypothetical protein